MKLLKNKCSIFILLILFVGMTSFEMSAEQVPCWYTQMYFRTSYMYPAWYGYSEEWLCVNDLIVCTYSWNDGLQGFVECLTGIPWSFTY